MAIKRHKVVRTETRIFRFGKAEEKVTAEFHDDMQGFAFRLRIGDQLSDWVSHYESFARIVSKQSGKAYLLGTQFWGDTFPNEEPFMVIPGSLNI